MTRESESIIARVQAAEKEAAAEVASAEKQARQAVVAAEAEAVEAVVAARRRLQQELEAAKKQAESEAAELESDSARATGAEVEAVLVVDRDRVERAAARVVEALKQRWRSNR